MHPADELSDEQIQAELAGEAVRVPRSFRGKKLAPLSRGLRDLSYKVLSAADTGVYGDVVLIYLLSEAFGETDELRLSKRAKLIADTDDIVQFRARISLFMDDLSDDEVKQIRAIADDILGLVEKAQVVIAEKKSEPAAANEEPSPMTTPSPSGVSLELPAGPQTTSAGS